MTAGGSGVVLDSAPVARLKNVRLQYGATHALDGIDLDFPAGRMVGLIGPDGVGKSSVLSLVAGARRVQDGTIQVLGGDMRDAAHRQAVCPRIAYMPQGLGKNLYPTLTVAENADFFGSLFGHDRRERQRRMADLFASTGLAPFVDRPAGKLSGGMKQKLSLCCSLIHDPDLLILDEPTTGVDPLSQRQFWELIDRIRADRPGMSVLVATAYMDEASRFDWLVAMDDGRVLATGSTGELLAATEAASLEEAFIALLPDAKRLGHEPIRIPPLVGGDRAVAIEARGLTKRFGAFTAVDHVTFRIEQGEIFGFLGSNGCGKTTTMKMLTGLLPASDGQAWLFGRTVDAGDLATRRRVGYMSQAFSLYSELTVRQNLELHARLFQVPHDDTARRISESTQRFGLADALDTLPEALPLGQRQRLSLAVALIHQPELLILDEPTSGVDPVARDQFWKLLIELSRRDRVTIFISTHFMNEASRCDRISLMHAGQVLVSNAPEKLVAERNASSLEDAFIAYLEEAASTPEAKPGAPPATAAEAPTPAPVPPATAQRFSLRRVMSFARRETLELSRDPIRLTLAGVGSVLLMVIMGYGITTDVENLTFAVLDRDQSTVSRDYVIGLTGSRYFTERPPILGYAELDRRMRSGEVSLAIEIPPRFGRDVGRGQSVELGVWIDGSMPQRGETIRSYVQQNHLLWLTDVARRQSGRQGPFAPAVIETRFRYNPDVESLMAMVPAVIPLLLLLIPAMLAALSVVREKELGSIINFYVTPVSPWEFLIGKQLPYVGLGMLNFLMLTVLAVTLFGVPLKGSFLAQSLGALVYVICATALGLLISSFMKSQIAAIFGTAILTILPATQFSGMMDPVSSLEGGAAAVAKVFPTTYFLTISRGAFSKALGLADLAPWFIPLVICAVVLISLSAKLLKKQEY